MAYHVSVTRLRLRSWRFLPSFALRTIGTLNQVKQAKGFESGSLLADRKSTFWTMTVWDSIESMRAYVTSGDHRTVMPLLVDWCDEASVVQWDQADASLPKWLAADLRMRQQGRPSKLRNPSPAHASLTFASPRLESAAPIKRNNSKRPGS